MTGMDWIGRGLRYLALLDIACRMRADADIEHFCARAEEQLDGLPDDVRAVIDESGTEFIAAFELRRAD